MKYKPSSEASTPDAEKYLAALMRADVAALAARARLHSDEIVLTSGRNAVDRKRANRLSLRKIAS
jgi:hypothetical protein